MVERWGQRLREVPRVLRDDLWTGAADPVPPLGGQPRRSTRLSVVVLIVLAAVLVFVNGNSYANSYRLSWQYGTVLGAVQPAALVGAFYRPIVAWWVSMAAMVLTTGLAQNNHGGEAVFPYGPGIIAQAGVMFLVALQFRPRVAGEVLVFSTLGILAGGRLSGVGRSDDSGRVVLVFVIAAVVGASLRGSRVARTQLVVQEELAAEERARRTRVEERNRIARELHDVVAHHMSVISIQAQVARHLAENPSEELEENLAGIRQNAVEALTELRRVLGVLRSEDAGAPGPAPDRASSESSARSSSSVSSASQGARLAPQPTLDRLGELLANVRGAGLTVTARTTGRPRPMAPGIELSAFRIVQEALSNAMRHAPGARVAVEIAFHTAGVTVRVVNSAPDRAGRTAPPPAPGTGHGLLGMRERTAMLGGELATGPTPDGGYEVIATLPDRPPEQAGDPTGPTESAGPAAPAAPVSVHPAGTAGPGGPADPDEDSP